jgi:hypothetical protein
VGAPAVSNRGRRREELERRYDALEELCESHPVTCGCDDCAELIVIYRDLCELGDPDSMEDEDKPYWWNR